MVVSEAVPAVVGHAEDRHGRVLGVGHALKGQYVGELRVGGDDADALAGILRGAAAQADQEVGTGFGELVDAVLDAFDRRVRLDVVEHLIRQAGLVQHIGDLLDGSGLQQHRIGDDERLGEAMGLGDRRNLLDGSTAEIRGLIENHAIDHAGSPLNAGSILNFGCALHHAFQQSPSIRARNVSGNINALHRSCFSACPSHHSPGWA